jgi:RNA polymerase sigma-70 factor (ECF subfamily)
MERSDLEDAFLAEVDVGARPRFAEAFAHVLASLYEVARAAYPDVVVEPLTFAGELARRLKDGASPERLANVRADHVYLAIACVAGNALAARRFAAEFLDEVDVCARRTRATPDQAADVRGHLSQILFVSEPGRPAALREFSGRGDLRSYLRVIATRELVRVIDRGRREVAITDQSLLDRLAPVSDPRVGQFRETYRADVDAAMRSSLIGLSEGSRALLRYSLLDGWSIDRIAALYGVHRATAARRIAAARTELGDAIRIELSQRLSIEVDEVDSVIRLVQSRIDASLERLLA